MSTKISELDLATKILVTENGVDVPYIITLKDQIGVEILRVKSRANTRQMNSTNISVYEGCSMDNWLVNEETGFLSLFEEEVLNTFATRSISTLTYGDTEAHYISRKCYLPSYGEMFGSNGTATEPEKTIVPILMRYRDTTNADTARRTTSDSSTSALPYWLRSPSSATAFSAVVNSGSSGSNNASINLFSVRPHININPDTIVGVTDDDQIYLIPSLIRTKTVFFMGKVLETPTRPAKALVQYNTVNLDNIDVKVCNNYGDPTPAWENATGQREVTMANVDKQTENWQVGVKCYGESTGYGYFEEPIVKLEVE